MRWSRPPPPPPPPLPRPLSQPSYLHCTAVYMSSTEAGGRSRTRAQANRELFPQIRLRPSQILAGRGRYRPQGAGCCFRTLNSTRPTLLLSSETCNPPPSSSLILNGVGPGGSLRPSLSVGEDCCGLRFWSLEREMGEKCGGVTVSVQPTVRPASDNGLISLAIKVVLRE